MKQTLLLTLWVCCGAPALLFGQSQSKLTVDYTENDRRCRDDAAVVRNCNVAYGHYTVTEAPMYHTEPRTYRFVLLCQPASQDNGQYGRKDCLPLEGGQSYSWSNDVYINPDKVEYWYQLYDDFGVGVVIVRTPNGSAIYAMKTLRPERLMSSGNMR
jgi:hypothetical protein